jgi:hypothetical protein
MDPCFQPRFPGYHTSPDIIPECQIAEAEPHPNPAECEIIVAQAESYTMSGF